MMSDNNEKKINKKENGRELFYGVIAVATFIIMTVGATFAFFTASTNSANSSVSTRSTKLEMDYISYGEAWKKDKLIPVDYLVAEYSVEKQDDSTASDDIGYKNTMCVDDDGNEICSIYVFQVRNKANSEQVVSINIVSENNGFSNLNAMIYEVAKGEGYVDVVEGGSKNDPKFEVAVEDPDDTSTIPIVNSNGDKLYDGVNGFVWKPIYVNRPNVTKTLLTYKDSGNSEIPSIRIPVKATPEGDATPVGERTSKLADNVKIPGIDHNDENVNLKTFMVVLYIQNLAQNQNDTDSEKEFTGMITVTTGEGSLGVSGKIGVATEDNLQSKPQTTTTTTPEEVSP